MPQQHSNTAYARLRPNSQDSDAERGPSQDSTTTDYRFNEKHTGHEPKPSSTLVNPRTIADATIGLSDGLTVPFALTAGLSALGDTNVVIYGGLAELMAGSISMGLGGYLGAKSEAAGYRAALLETQNTVRDAPHRAANMVRDAFVDFDFPASALEAMVAKLLACPDGMVDFLMRFHHQLAEDDFTTSLALKCGVTIAAGYFIGGLVPLLPYLLFSSMNVAFVGSVLVMLVALFAFGWIKTALLAEKNRLVCAKNGVQMVIMGSLAAGAAMGCVKAVGG